MDRTAYDIDGRMGLLVLEFARVHPRSSELMVLPTICALQDGRAFGLSWNLYTSALNGLVSVLGEEAVVEGLSTDAFGSSDFAVVLEAMATLATPERMFRFFMGVGGRFNPGVESSMETVSPGVLRVRLDLRKPPADAMLAPVYFRLTQRMFELLPAKLLGTRESVVVLETDGVSGVFVVHLPPSRTVWARLKNVWNALIGRVAMAELVFDEQVLARARMLELQRVSDELDERVATRTLELAGLNDRLRAISANKSRHLADMSHELRTPLNAIIGYAEMLAEDAELADERTVTADLHRIDTAAHYLLRLIDNVLDLSKIEAGQLEVELQQMDLAPRVLTTVDSLRSVLEAAGNTIHVEVSSVVASVDGMRLQQIVANLLGNAAKFCANGEISVRLRLEGTLAVVEVCDTGCGMSPVELSDVFEPYRQGRPVTASSFQGTGLGLPISRELARLMEGTLTASSTIGEGSVFTLRVPASGKAADPQRRTQPSIGPGLPASWSDKNSSTPSAVEAGTV